MQAVNQKDDLFTGQSSQPAGKVAFICPGGIISRAALEATGKPAAYWRDVYLDADKLFQLAEATHELGRTDNYAVPLCLTVEAELFGAQIDYCASFCELKIRKYPFRSLEGLLEYEGKHTGRREVVLEVIRRLKSVAGNTPVFGNVTGPLTLLTQLVESSVVFKAIPRYSCLVFQALERLTLAIEEYGLAQIEAGATVLTINDPTANGEILGPGFFAQFCTPPLRKLFKSFAQRLPEKTILHICGRVDNLITQLKWLPFSILSVDSTADIKGLKQALGKTIIGSVCTQAMTCATPAQIKALAQKVINQGAAALSLPCGLNPATPLNNLQAMRQAIHKSEAENK